MFEGAFWNYTDVSLLTKTHNNKVIEITVIPSTTQYNTKTDIDLLVSNLNKKYGNYISINRIAGLVSYNWAAKGGSIKVTYDLSLFYITLRYIDCSSPNYVNPNAAKNATHKTIYDQSHDFIKNY